MKAERGEILPVNGLIALVMIAIGLVIVNRSNPGALKSGRASHA